MPSLMLALLLASADGGYFSAYEEAGAYGPPDAPYENPDAGLYEVRAAVRYDGGVLPDGWWLSPERLEAVGADLRGCERDLWMARELEARAGQTCAAPQATISLFPTTIGFVPGLVLGFVGGSVVVGGAFLLLGR